MRFVTTWVLTSSHRMDDIFLEKTSQILNFYFFDAKFFKLFIIWPKKVYLTLKMYILLTSGSFFAKNISLLEILFFVIFSSFFGNFLKILKIVVERRVRRQSLHTGLNYFFKSFLGWRSSGVRRNFVNCKRSRKGDGVTRW